MGDSERSVYERAERVARQSRGRLVAYLAARTRDLADAEDALAEAFRVALETWPARGIPDNPEAWLLTVARRRLTDAFRREGVLEEKKGEIARMHGASREARVPGNFPDQRVDLLFVCAHPAIAPEARTPLMLQTVLGMDANRIAAAFLSSPAAMAQRLVRAKRKIKQAGIAFALPEAPDLPERLEAVLEAIYGAFTSSWTGLETGEAGRRAPAEEAVYLARLLAEYFHESPEAAGLLALLLFCDARKGARLVGGRYVPLRRQDPELWRSDMLEEAEGLLRAASMRNRPGRFQLEAAIQSAHIRGILTGATDHEDIALLYEGLLAYSPTIGVYVGRAAAAADALSPEVGLRLLEELPEESVRDYQPFWAVKTSLLQRMDRGDETRTSYLRALGLTADPAVREFLREQYEQ